MKIAFRAHCTKQQNAVNAHSMPSERCRCVACAAPTSARSMAHFFLLHTHALTVLPLDISASLAPTTATFRH